MFGQNKSGELHTWVEARLSDFIDNQLPANERARMEQHLAGCAQCRASLESMQWSLALLKQAPAPTTRKNFTLPVPAPRARPSFAFGAARWATALATLALIAVIGIDVITQMSGSAAPVSMSAPSADIQAMPTTIAIAPTAAPQPTLQSKAAGAAPPASSSSAASSAPAPAPQFAAPTPTRPAAAASAFEVAPTQAANDAAKTQTGRAPVASTAIATATATPTATSTPTPTATPLPPTETPAPTLAAQVRETATPLPLVSTNNAPAVFPPVRLAEIALLFAAIFFGTLMVLLWRQK